MKQIWKLIGAICLAFAATIAIFAIIGGLEITGFGSLLIGILCFAGVLFIK